MRVLRSLRQRLGQSGLEQLPVFGASQGVGPLLQRDYWAVIDGCRYDPVEVMQLVRARFAEFAPPDLVAFRPQDDESSRDGLTVGLELDVKIRGINPVAVRVAHVDAQSFTLCTLAGHPEAGRITFGAYRNDRGDVIFHIRSRARSSTRTNRYGFLVAGNPMQTSTWTDFVGAVAFTCGNGVVGFLHAETERIRDDQIGHDDERGPTFRVTGG